MTPHEKAKELYHKMCLPEDMYHGKPYAKKCALIAVDEISEHCYQVMKPFWQEVKQEIEKL